MPELPEVETVKNTLKKLIIGKKITNVTVNYSGIIEYPSFDDFCTSIVGEVINDISRRGKWLMFELDNYYLLSHLRMEGRYFYKNSHDEHYKHEHVIFELDKKMELRYIDTRKFGKMHLIKKELINLRKPLSELGLEPFDMMLDSDYLIKKYCNKKLPIKTVLLDQSIIVGIGNIYADEILFLSKINPLKRAMDLKNDECNSIIENARNVLNQAIKAGGTTIKSYESSEGVHGRFQTMLYVHGKEKCQKCNQKIEKIRVGGRGTYYCPNCQK